MACADRKYPSHPDSAPRTVSAFAKARALNHRALDGVWATIRRLRAALAIAIAAPMLAGCSTQTVLYGNDVSATVNRLVFLPAPPPLVCQLMVAAGGTQVFATDPCAEKVPILYDPVTGSLYFGCNLAGAWRMISLGLSPKACFVFGSIPNQSSAYNDYFRWLATQGIATPGVSGPVLTNTPTNTATAAPD
jgi:hypothetical protein